ncbi:DnaD domain protein [Bacillus sp. FSL W8-0519]|uniref:DnaD domain protein n=1 Tax=Bacillus TaxID=1386 RepID=UPI0009375001|nr:DnaD domain protein [Bacillus paranthracis]
MNSKVLQIGQMNFRGNVIDHGWFKTITLDNGKPYVIAITILGEVVYWYKPTEIRNEESNQVKYKQKFKADMLQKNYQQLADSFGFTKRQVKDACDYLKDRNLLHIEFRTVIVNGTRCNNVMFIEPVPEEIQKISILYWGNGTPPTLKRNSPPTIESNSLLRSNVPPSYDKTEEPPTLERKTNTEITTEITTNIDDDGNHHPLIDPQFKNSLEHLMKSNIPLSVIAEQELGEFCDSFGSELVNRAVDKAIDENAPRWAYIRKILINWQKSNVKTLADVIKLDEDYKNQRGGVENATRRGRVGKGFSTGRSYEEENASRERNMPSFIKRV